MIKKSITVTYYIDLEVDAKPSDYFDQLIEDTIIDNFSLDSNDLFPNIYKQNKNSVIEYDSSGSARIVVHIDGIVVHDDIKSKN